MKLILIDKLEIKREYENATIVPRKGEKIGDWYCDPPPTVKEVIHFVQRDEIVVVLG